MVHSLPDRIYSLGEQLKIGGEKGDPTPSDHGEMKKACTQATRWANGLLKFLYANDKRAFTDGATFAAAIPVVFTTASLWVSDVALNAADLATGNLTTPDEPPRKVPWVFMQVPMSPSMRFAPLTFDKATDLPDSLVSLFLRTIPIVSAAHITEFLNKFQPRGIQTLTGQA